MQNEPSPDSILSPPLDAARPGGKFLIFHLDNEAFGTEVRKVLEIMGLQDITSIPRVPNYVKGVINLRGKVIPVIDLRLKFGLPPKEYLARTCIVVVRVQGPEESSIVGVIVDGVDEVLNIDPADIEDMPDFGANVDTPYLSGVVRISGSVKLLLDIDYVLNTQLMQGIPTFPQ